MSAPSFLYSGIDKETLSLSDELNSMGGGDAQASHLELHAIINYNMNKNDTQLLWPYDNMLGLRDVSLPIGSPVSKSMKYFPMDSVTVHSNGLDGERQEIADIALDSSHWVDDGFNSCIFSLGMRGSGKTTAMFGHVGLEQQGSNNISNCLARNVLESLFERKRNALSRRESVTTIALSAWSVVHDRITDLVAPVATSREALDFASVECPDISTACRILHDCRSRAPGCLAYGGESTHESRRGHFFLRILLHKRSLQDNVQQNDDAGTISYMYLVDLLGLATTDNATFNRLPEDTRIATRANNLQLQCLFKILAEMRALSAAAATNPFTPAEAALTSAHTQKPANASIMKMTSARDSKLTTILAPTIQGNVKSSVLLFLQDGANYASETQNLLNSVNGVTGIISACLRIKGISLRSLGLVQHDSVLPVYFDPTRHPPSLSQPQSQAPLFVPAPYSPERDSRNHAAGSSSVYMPSPDLPYTYSPARPAQAHTQQAHVQHAHSNNHASPALELHHSPYHGGSGSVLTDTSTDYGEMDFDRILAGDFLTGGSKANKQSSGGVKSPPKFPLVGGSHGHSELHPHYQQADLQRVAHPPSQGFIEHRKSHYHSEAHPSSSGAHHTEALHPHIREADIRRVEHAPSQEFLDHRKNHYHSEAHPSSAHHSHVEHHAHISEADARRVELAPSQEFLEHRRAFNHSELHPTHSTADGHYVEEHHPRFQTQDVHRVSHAASAEFLEHRRAFNHSELHPTDSTADGHYQHEHDNHPRFQAQDLQRVNHAPSNEFIEHRRAFNHSELHPTDRTADGHYIEESHPQFKKQDLQRVAHPPSQGFIEHRKSHYHSEAHPSSSGAHHTEALHPHIRDADIRRVEHAPSPGFIDHRKSHYHSEAHPSSAQSVPSNTQSASRTSGQSQGQSRYDDDESPVRGPRTHPEVLQVLDEYHDLMEELENDHHAETSRDRELHGQGSPSEPRDISMSFPRQVVKDFLQNNRRSGGVSDSPPRSTSTTRQQASPGGRSSRSASPQRHDRQARDSRSRSPSREEHKNRRNSPERVRERRDVSSIGPGQAQYGADESFFSHFQFPVAISPKREASSRRSGRKSSARKSASGAVDSSMMADSLFAGSEFDASFDNGPIIDDNYTEKSPPRGYKYRYGSARTSVESSGTRTGEFAAGSGIGGSTAAPVTLRGPCLADTDPADLDTVNHITSSYAEFFQDSLLAADPLNRMARLAHAQDDWQDGDGPEEYIYTSSGDVADSSHTDRSHDLDNTVDSLDLEDSPARPLSQTQRGSPSQKTTSTSPGRKSHDRDSIDARMPSSYVPYLDAAIPEGSMTLPEAVLELEHLRRTNHALVESLSEESHRRSELEEKLSGAQDDLLEVRTQCDVQLDSYKLEIRQLKAQMRTICDNQSLTDVFATFEDNVARLVRENEALRQTNLHLEAKELDSLTRGGVNGTLSDVNAFENHNTDAGGESYRLQTAKKENLRLMSKLRKSGIEREVLKKEFEEVKAKERQFVVNAKIANDCARRLRITHQDLLRAKKELEIEQAARAVAERDLHLIREDTAGLRVSEAVLKEERARNLSELAMLRERVREVDHERRRLSQLHRFVEKHFDPTYAVPHHSQPAQPSPPRRGASQNAFAVPPPPPPPAVSSILKAAPALSTLSSQPYRQRIVAALSQNSREMISGGVAPYSMPSAVPYSGHSVYSDEQKGSYDESDSAHGRVTSRSEGTVGQAGLSDAQYFRLEESDGIEPALEVSLTAMHESLICTTPQLLPLFRKLTTDIHTERTKALQKRSQLLNQLGTTQYERPVSENNTSKVPVNVKDTNAAYLNMLKSRGLGNGSSYVTQHEGKVSQAGAKKTTKSVRF